MCVRVCARDAATATAADAPLVIRSDRAEFSSASARNANPHCHKAACSPTKASRHRGSWGKGGLGGAEREGIRGVLLCLCAALVTQRGPLIVD